MNTTARPRFVGHALCALLFAFLINPVLARPQSDLKTAHSSLVADPVGTGMVTPNQKWCPPDDPEPCDPYPQLNKPPVISWSAIPVNGSWFLPTDTIAFGAYASDPDGSIARVRFLLDHHDVVSDTTAPYQASVSRLSAGTHTLSAVAEDNLGRTAQPSEATIYVRNSVIKGSIDGVSSTGLITGWACSTYLPQSISVDIYVGGPSGTGTGIGRFTANKASEAAVASSCNVGGGLYRYQIQLSDAQRIAHGGKSIYAYGISPIGANNNLLGGSASVTVPTYILDARYVGQTVSKTMGLGEVQSVSVNMRNDGGVTWSAGSKFKLGSQKPTDNSTWGVSRVTLTSNVAPGQIATFTFNITAPSKQGSYNFQWKMLQEGVAWFGDVTSNVSIAVSGPPPTVVVSSSVKYDELGQVIERRGGDGTVVASYAYDGEGHVTRVTDGLNKVTTMEYDALGRLSKSAIAINGVTQYAYDVANNLTKVTDPRGLVTSYTYDGFGQLWTQTSPDTGTSQQTFNASGQLTSSTRNSGTTVSYSYDSLGRVTHKTAGQEAQNYSYDSCAAGLGRLCVVSDAMSSESFGYSPQGDVILKKLIGPNSGGMVTKYAYDGNGRLAELTYPDGAIAQYSYVAGRVSLLKLTAGGVSTNVIKGNTYNAAGQPTYWLYGNNAYRMQSFDLNGRLSSLRTMVGSNTLQNYNFVYSAAGLMTQRIDMAFPAQSATYAYDAVGRLTSELTNAAGSRLDYTYDGNGNRTSINWVGVGVTNHTIASGSNQLKRNGADTYTYNPNGDRESWTAGTSTAIYTYDAFGRMMGTSRNVPYSTWTATYPAGVTSYAVNPLGQRVYKEGPTGEFWFDYSPNGQLLSDYITGQGWTNYVYFQGKPVALVRGGSVSYLHDDHLGRPESATNNGGTVVWSAANASFGRNGSQGSLVQVNLGFPGQYYDSETGHWYNVNRDYDQGSGRYLESDPIGLAGGIDTYAYVGNDPLNNTDQLGLQYLTAGVPSLPPFPSNATNCEKNALANGGAQMVPFVGLYLTLTGQSFTPFGNGSMLTSSPASQWDVMSGTTSAAAGFANSDTANTVAGAYIESGYRDLSTGNKAYRRSISSARRIMWTGTGKALGAVGGVLEPLSVLSAYLGAVEGVGKCGCGK